MDATDIQDIAIAVGELMDQTCTVYREGTELGTYDCLVLVAGASGGVNGANPDPYNAEASAIDVYEVYLPLDARTDLKSGSALVASDGLSLSIIGTNVGESLSGFYLVTASEQTIGTPAFTIIFHRWDPGTLAFIALPPVEVQASLLNLVTVPAPGPTGTAQQADIVIISEDRDLDVQVGDTFTYDGGTGHITHVVHSDRTEARGRIQW
jgi:hypothetical protein